jgi:hypothetical protein
MDRQPCARDPWWSLVLLVATAGMLWLGSPPFIAFWDAPQSSVGAQPSGMSSGSRHVLRAVAVVNNIRWDWPEVVPSIPLDEGSVASGIQIRLPCAPVQAGVMEPTPVGGFGIEMARQLPSRRRLLLVLACSSGRASRHPVAFHPSTFYIYVYVHGWCGSPWCRCGRLILVPQHSGRRHVRIYIAGVLVVASLAFFVVSSR